MTRLLPIALLVLAAAAAWIVVATTGPDTAPPPPPLANGSAPAPTGPTPGQERTMPAGREVGGSARRARVRFVVSRQAEAVVGFARTTVTAWAGATLLASGMDPALEFEVPARIDTIVFAAVGYRSVARPVPVDATGPIDFGTIEVEPDAGLAVSVDPAPDGETSCSVTADAVVVATQRGAGRLELPVPSDTHLALHAQVARGVGTVLHLPSTPLLLRSGEHREIRLRRDGEVVVELTGMSRALLEHVEVEIEWGADRERQALVVRPDGGGRVAFAASSGACRASVVCAEGDSIALLGNGATVDLAAGTYTLVAAAEPVVALGVVRAGRLVPSALGLDTFEIDPTTRPAHVFARSLLDATQQVNATIAGAHDVSVPMAMLRAEGDVWLLDADEAPRLGELQVAAPHPLPGSIVAEPLTSGAGVPLVRSRLHDPLGARLPAGAYRLLLTAADRRRSLIERFEIVAGETTSLQLPPVGLERWRVRLRSPPEPRYAAMLFVAIDGMDAHLGGDGTCTIDLAFAPRPGTACELQLPSQGTALPATIASADATSRTIELDADVGRATWTRIEPDVKHRPAWILVQTTEGRTTSMLVTDEPNLVTVRPGTAAAGCLRERIDGEDEVTCWFRVDHGTPSLAVAARGRWCTLRFERPFARATIALRGPWAMEPVPVRHLVAAADTRVFVAEGTAAIEVDLVPGGRRTLPPDGELLVVR